MKRIFLAVVSRLTVQADKVLVAMLARAHSTAVGFACLVLVSFAAPLEAAPAAPPDAVLDVIDIRPIVPQNEANVAGLAFDADAQALYMSLGSIIYTLDLRGNVLAQLNVHDLIPGTLPDALSYQRSTGKLFVFASFYADENAEPEGRLLVIDPRSNEVSVNVPIESGGGTGIHIAEDGLWQTLFAEDILRHYAGEIPGEAFEDISVAATFPGFPGPGDIAESFAAGNLLVLDWAGRQIVEFDRSGREINATSTVGLGSGLAFALETDLDDGRIFLEVNNEDIFVLSAEFVALPQQVAVAIKPRRYVNYVNPRSEGTVAVAILTTRKPRTGIPPFDATTVDPSTARFGLGAAAPALHRYADVDDDGDADLVLHFRIRETGITCDTLTAALWASTYAGEAIRGTDDVCPVGCPP